MKQVRIRQVRNLRRFKLLEGSPVNYLKFFSGFGWHFYFILTSWGMQATKANVPVYVKK